MAQTGRKPLGAGHVERLQGSPRARQRMRLMLECMQGLVTTADASRQLEICESRFHAMRNQWLQQSLELLEPRPSGRPPKRPQSDELLERVAQLEKENRDLQQQLRAAQLRQEIAEITARPETFKKTRRRKRRRCARR